LSAATAARIKDRIAEAPDLVVEVVSPDSREYDLKTKRNDYEAAGVAEYWVIDPHAGRMYFYALEAGRYREQAASDNHYASKVLAGFVLDLARLRKLF
jgi:Uma2 family endonuclease